VQLRVLTWNLLHGRSVPSSGRDLYEDFAAALASWQCDVALLQEVPPGGRRHSPAAAAGSDVDHIFVAGPLQPTGPPAQLDRRQLSDHAPLAVDLRLGRG
jgi:endonuclease/exonuclease/phosphatase family metal-dependent hydrolase